MSKSHSPTRHRESQRRPLPSCLVRRETSPSGDIPRLKRSTSLSPPSNMTTIPLRSCCPDCIPVIDNCLSSGSKWQEKFSRGAQRRRTTSLDISSSRQFGTVACHNSEAVVSSSFPGVLAINVDEADNHPRRRSFGEDESERVWQDLPGHLDRERSSSTGSTCSSHRRFASDSVSGSTQPDPTRVLPIEEEDEDQLFPLPSPRRSPNVSPTPSPNASTSCLYGSPFGSSPRTSRDSLHSHSASSEDSHCSLPRMRCDKGLLTPDVSPALSHCTPSGLRGLSSSPNHSSPSLLQSTQSPAQRKSSPSVFSSSLHTRPSPTFSQKASHHPLASSFSKDSLPPSPTSPDPKTGASSISRRSRGPSFSIPKPTSFLKVGAEVLKGVGSINGGAGHTLSF
jgi:hypothetical protein